MVCLEIIKEKESENVKSNNCIGKLLLDCLFLSQVIIIRAAMLIAIITPIMPFFPSLPLKKAAVAHHARETPFSRSVLEQESPDRGLLERSIRLPPLSASRTKLSVTRSVLNFQHIH